jgi:hypothetical protein
MTAFTGGLCDNIERGWVGLSGNAWMCMRAHVREQACVRACLWVLYMFCLWQNGRAECGGHQHCQGNEKLSMGFVGGWAWALGNHS